MRIVSGKYRRRKLLSAPGNVTRPITDRIKEILFERIGQDFQDKRMADVFAGTGTIGLEALSRGARSVVFIENDRRAYKLLTENVAQLGVEEPVLCWRADVMRCSFYPKGVPQLLPFDVVFFDPPYRLVPDIRPKTPFYKALQRLAREGVTSADALLLIRTPLRSQFQCPDLWVPDQTMSFSNMEIHLFDKDKQQEQPHEHS